MLTSLFIPYNSIYIISLDWDFVTVSQVIQVFSLNAAISFENQTKKITTNFFTIF